MSKQILVVDDHGPWRRQIRSLLRTTTAWEASGEAADGWEAVEQAEALRPDLILLDVELPTLNGIEAARRILTSDPDSRILFVSAHRSWDIVDAAVATGARGYLLKTSAVEELVPAMDTVAAGGRFISPALTGRRIDSEEHTSPLHYARCHEVGFYSEEALLVDGYVRFVDAALRAGKAVVFVGIDSRQKAVLQKLKTGGVDVDLAIEEGRLILIDVADALSMLLVDGWPEEAQFWQAGASLIARARKAARGPHPYVAACGEGAASLLQAGKADAAIRLEHLWDDLARTYNVDIFCGYCRTAGPDHNGGDVFQRICAEHSAVYKR
jgi:DNA-binding NarL/FixJ family response regulator